MAKKNFWLGAGEIGLGLLLIGPADEMLTTALSAGTGAALAPIQVPTSAAIGALLCLDGINRL
jgi:hypothetical protein